MVMFWYPTSESNRETYHFVLSEAALPNCVARHCLFGAHGGSRTLKTVRPLDSKSSAYTNFATHAYYFWYGWWESNPHDVSIVRF